MLVVLFKAKDSIYKFVMKRRYRKWREKMIREGKLKEEKELTVAEKMKIAYKKERDKKRRKEQRERRAALRKA